MADEQTTEQKVLFALSPVDEKGHITIIMGVPEAAWEYMKEGKTHHWDFVKVGLPIKLIMYGGKNHQECYDAISKMLRDKGVEPKDERDRDFGINPEEPNPDFSLEDKKDEPK